MQPDFEMNKLYPLAGRALDQFQFMLSGIKLTVHQGGKIDLPLNEVTDALIVIKASTSPWHPKGEGTFMSSSFFNVRLELTDVEEPPNFRFRAADIKMVLKLQDQLIEGRPDENVMHFEELLIDAPYAIIFPDDRSGNVRSPLRPGQDPRHPNGLEAVSFAERTQEDLPHRIVAKEDQPKKTTVGVWDIDGT